MCCRHSPIIICDFVKYSTTDVTVVFKNTTDAIANGLIVDFKINENIHKSDRFRPVIFFINGKPFEVLGSWPYRAREDQFISGKKMTGRFSTDLNKIQIIQGLVPTGYTFPVIESEVDSIE